MISLDMWEIQRMNSALFYAETILGDLLNTQKSSIQF